jgi:hypothetical protein
MLTREKRCRAGHAGLDEEATAVEVKHCRPGVVPSPCDVRFSMISAHRIVI